MIQGERKVQEIEVFNELFDLTILNFEDNPKTIEEYSDLFNLFLNLYYLIACEGSLYSDNHSEKLIEKIRIRVADAFYDYL